MWHQFNYRYSFFKNHFINFTRQLTNIFVVRFAQQQNLVLDTGTNKSVQRLCGDVDYDEAAKVASYITPVPGGVGPMTVAMLMKNTVQSYLKWVQQVTASDWKLSTLPLKLIKPIPSDIAIARAQQPKDIRILAEEIGLQSNEVHLFGPKKAKVSLKTLDRLRDRDNGKYVVVAG